MLAVNDHAARAVFLVLAGFDKSVPIVHHDFDGMHPGRIEQPVFIPSLLAGSLQAQGFAIHKKQRQEQRQDNGGNADAVYILAR